jgi:formylglycine-generating enzyme required for sulfatase activity
VIIDQMLAELALIPAGSFTMGSTSGDADQISPPVTVNVSAFYMGKNEVTKDLWVEVRNWATTNGYTDIAAGAGKASNHPIQTVSWWDVIKWCNARSEKEGLTPCYTIGGEVMKTGTTIPAVNWTANGYRLPTEAEWEKAARGGVSGKRFPWGTDTISHNEANFRNSGSESYKLGTSGFHPTYATGTLSYTSPVGSFAANGFGLNDMAGNIFEWCWDWYGASTYVNGETDPRGAASGWARVIRGGCWNDSALLCRAANRKQEGSATRNNCLGFRIARSSDASEMTFIPAGNFTMGSTSGDSDPDSPPVTVNVSAFYMGKNEVTKNLWVEVRNWATTNGYTDIAAGAGKASNHPIQTVSWWDVIKWCNARSEKEGLTPCYTIGGEVMKTGTTIPAVNWTANGYRLPTEAEWEKAARGGVSGKRFPWGTDTISHNEANFFNYGSDPYQSGTTGYHPSYASGFEPYTSPVGFFLANGFGLNDTAGNVSEWCWDWYGASTYANGAQDPRGAEPGSDTGRVLRGGCWPASGRTCAASYRSFSAPMSEFNTNGFRVARTSVP